MDNALRATFRRPFPEQVAAFRLRLGNLVPTSRWDDLDRSAHDSAFMVAGATKADLLADLAGAVDRAISEGTGIETFRKDFDAIVERHGWHGWTGEETEAGRAWRTRVIYATNMRVSMAAGRNAQLRDGNFPFWVYRHSGAEHPRLQHLGWDGLVLPPDHPFWALHYPPNGWGCGCYVRGTRSKRRARNVGGDPDKKLPDGWDRIDPRTGAPVGIDKGWDYAPGSTVSQTVSAMTAKTVHWPFELAKAFMEDLPEATVNDFARAYRQQPSLADATRRFVQSIRDRDGAANDVVRSEIGRQYLTWGRLTSQHVDEMNRAGIAAAGYDFAVEIASVRHFAKHMGKDGFSIEQAGRFASLLDQPLALEEIARRTATETGAAQIGLDVVLDGRRLRLVFERRRKRRMLVLVTAYFIE